jgi:hypothetical protein
MASTNVNRKTNLQVDVDTDTTSDDISDYDVTTKNPNNIDIGVPTLVTEAENEDAADAKNKNNIDACRTVNS